MIYIISVFKDIKDTILTIPKAKNEKNISVDINKPVVLKKPYDTLMLGDKIKECFKICIKEPFIHSNDFVKVYENVTGIKSYSAFSKDRLMIALFMDTEKGFTVLPLVRHSDGSYRPSKERYPEIKLDLSTTSEHMGNVVMDIFKTL